MTFRTTTLATHFALFLCLTCATAFARRFVPVEITWNGKVILEGNVSDDGLRDADAVWEALAEARLRETEAFKRFEIAPDVKEHKLRAGRDEIIRIRVSYGGDAHANELTIRQVSNDPKVRVWRVATADVGRLSDDRLISRKQAAELTKHKQLRHWSPRETEK